MTLYLDTSLLVAALTFEAESQRALAWLDDAADETLAISPWVVAEFSAALSVKLRRGEIGTGERDDALRSFATLVIPAVEMLAIEAACYEAAARFADRHSSGIRAADALHLAIATVNDAALCTLDRRLAKAAEVLGVSATLV